jgi:hypothetical protein
MNRFKTLVLFTFVVLAFASCNKCYDKELKKEYQNAVCPQDCPGVTGCDGQFYCNECKANQQGIIVH